MRSNKNIFTKQHYEKLAQVFGTLEGAVDAPEEISYDHVRYAVIKMLMKDNERFDNNLFCFATDVAKQKETERNKKEE